MVSQLNGNPFFSKDRLTRVKNLVYFNTLDAYLSAVESSSTFLLDLGSDCRVYFLSTFVESLKPKKRRKDSSLKSSKSIAIANGVDGGCWYIERIQFDQ